MALSLAQIEEAHQKLKEYTGNNPYMIDIKNWVYAYKNTLNDFKADFVLRNYDKEPKFIHKSVKLADWYGEELQMQLNLEFTPKVLVIGWYLGETEHQYVFYAKYRRSQEDGILLVAPKKGILTNFLVEDYNKLELDFAPYEEKAGIRLYEHQKEAIKFLISRKRAILSLDMGFGKCEPITSEIPTPNGFKKMGEIKIGDEIFGSDGKKHNVLGVFPQGKKDIYKVHFTDGTFCRCGEEHLWIVKKYKTPKNKPWKVMSLKEIMDYGIKNPKNKHENYWKIPMCEAVDYDEVKHFIHPYMLGMMIGDGNLCNGTPNISIPDFERETVKNITEVMDDRYVLNEDRTPNCPRYRIVRKIRQYTKGENEYKNEIERLGLNVKGNLKFIPDEYKLDSINNRIELLRGLMDSDGTIGAKNRISFSTSSERLANDVKELVYSLGGRSTIHKYVRADKINKDGNPTVSFVLCIQIKVNPFKIKRKAERYNPTNVKYCSKYICKVEKDGNEEAQCIYVDSHDHSYLTGHNYIVTHNTISAILAALMGNYEHILVISPSSVKKTWEKELKLFVDDDDITIVKGSKWDDAKFTIINYDILDNFYTIPTQKIKKKELSADDEGNLTYEYKEKEIVSRSKKIIDEAMADSQLFQAKYDLIIIDEAHRLSNNTSGRFKIIQDLIKRSKPKGIFEITGTIITNGSKNLYNILKIIDVPVTRDWQNFMTRYCGAKFLFKKNERNALTAIFCKEHDKPDWYSLSSDEKKELDEVLEKKLKKICIPGENTNMEELQEIIKPYYLRRTKDEIENMVKKTIKYLHYEMTDEEKNSYDNLWDEYVALKEDPEKSEKNKKLEEVSLLRQWLAEKMIPRTIDLAEKCIERGHKVIIFCAYDKEVNTLREHFKEKCVYHNGKLTEKKKNDAIEKFQNDDSIKVFIGNIVSAGVGLTLIAGTVVIFNNFSFVPSDNQQCEDRIHRINQTKPCTVYYQSFNGTYFDRMLEINKGKQDVIDKIIISEKEK